VIFRRFIYCKTPRHPAQQNSFRATRNIGERIERQTKVSVGWWRGLSSSLQSGLGRRAEPAFRRADGDLISIGEVFGRTNPRLLERALFGSPWAEPHGSSEPSERACQNWTSSRMTMAQEEGKALRSVGRLKLGGTELRKLTQAPSISRSSAVFQPRSITLLAANGSRGDLLGPLDDMHRSAALCPGHRKS